MRWASTLLGLVVFLVAGCGGDDDSGDDGMSTIDSGPGSIDGAASGIDAAQVACPGDQGGAVLEAESNFWDGPIVACGTVTLPDDAMTGRPFQLLVYRVDGIGGNEFLGPGTTGDTSTVYFRIGLEAGQYRLGLRADDTGNTSFESGDLQGFYDGTTAAPIVDVGGATLIELQASRADLDFGLGRIE